MRRVTCRVAYRLALGLAVLGLCTGALAEAVVLTLERAGVSVPSTVNHGVNYGNFMRVVGYEASLAPLALSAWRFPPGNQADEIEITPGVADALALNLGLLGGPSVLLVANLFSGTPEQAVAAVALLEERGIRLVGVQVGNEPDLYAANRLDPSWTPAKYCTALREYRAALHATYPQLAIYGPGTSGGLDGAPERYLGAVLAACGDAIDVLAWHLYPTDGRASDDAALATSPHVSDQIARYAAWAANEARNPLGHEHPPRLAVTEFGLSWRSQSFRHLEDHVAAVWLADTLARMATSGLLGESYYYALQATGGHGFIDSSGWVRPTLHAYAMASALRGEVLRATLEPQVPGAYAYATCEAGELRLLVVNTTHEDLLVALPSAGAAALQTATLDQTATNAGDAPRLAAQPAAALAAPALALLQASGAACP